MTVNDPIADLLTRIRNAKSAQHRFVDASLSKMNGSIAKILKDNGFIENFLTNEKTHKIRIFLKYTKNRESVIHGLKRVSSPGLRKYVPYTRIPKIFGGIGCAVLSTSKGVVDNAAARDLKVGGELLCYVW